MSKKEHIIPGSVDTSEKIKFLGDPLNYPEHPGSIEIIETHMSLLFLTKDHVYKMKKPLILNSIDFTDLKSRELNCREEVRINSELAEGVYLEVLSLGIDEHGKLHWNGENTIEWLVKMKRLKEEHLLDNVIRTGKVDPGILRKAALKLVNFYEAGIAIQYTPMEYIERLERKIRENYEELQDPEFGFSEPRLRALYEGQLEFLEKRHELLKERVISGKIMEVHGDLKPEHICLEPEPLIIDRLEFDQDLRILDPVEELSFLSVECELLESRETGATFFEVYKEISQDKIPEELIHFYKSKQASLRSKFAIWHIKEERYRNEPKWKELALRYLNVSEHYLKLLKV